MRRGARIAIVLIVILAALLAINTIVLNGQTRDAEVTVDGGELAEVGSAVELQYVDRPAGGRGPEGQPIVLLHCYTCSTAWWDELSPLLNRGHRVIAIDLIGHGGSEKPSSGYEITAQSAAVGELLNELGVRGATVVGHSMGGLVATSLAEQASELVDRVVLIGTASDREQSELPFTARLATTPVIGQAIWRLKLDSMVKSASAEAFAPGTDAEEAFPGNPDQVVEDVDAMTYTSFRDARDASGDFVDEGSPASRLTAIGVPLLAIVGAEDRILDVDEVISGFESVPGARIEEMDGVGHSPNIENPEATAELILPFVAEGEEFAVPAPRPQAQGRPGRDAASGGGGGPGGDQGRAPGGGGQGGGPGGDGQGGGPG